MLKDIFSKRFILHFALALVAVVAAIAGSYYYLQTYTKQDSVVSVPSLEGYDIVEAEAVLKEYTLEGIVVDSLYLPETRGGQIVDQEPKAASFVKENRKIYLTISRYSSPMVKLPNIEEQTLALALAKLSSYGIEVGELINKPSDCTDCVIGVLIDNKEIEPGTPINKGLKVDLLVGEGATGEKISIPVLFGLTVDEAQQLVNRAGLNIGATVYIDCENAADSTAARIYRQLPHPNPNDRIMMGSSVDVYLSEDLTLLPNANIDSIKAQITH
ncbi:MAG: PASTA domain-containing protein [Flavobacteriales bacterium]|nr:PASTA domain-containing protein [Flavobacteriales bacterium]